MIINLSMISTFVIILNTIILNRNINSNKYVYIIVVLVSYNLLFSQQLS